MFKAFYYTNDEKQAEILKELYLMLKDCSECKILFIDCNPLEYKYMFKYKSAVNQQSEMIRRILEKLVVNNLPEQDHVE
jgi:hypothetical protein